MKDLDQYWKDQSKSLGFTVNDLKSACHNSLLIWSETHRKIMGLPFSLEDYPYMEEIYMDLSRECCYMKSAQSSFSEYAVNLLFWITDTNRGHGYLAFPTAKDVSVFVQGRIDTVKDETPYIRSRLKGSTDNTSIKRFGYRNIYFTGSQKRTQIISSPADCIIQDEYDEHNPAVDTTVQKRANNSKLKMFRRISTPTMPGYGIHREYMKSSKAVWIHKCKTCGENVQVSGEDIADRWQEMIKLVGGSYQYCCPKCNGDCDFTQGKWRHREPDNLYKGYSINRMMTKTCPASELMKAHDEAVENDSYAEFLRSDLGVPYEMPGSRIYAQDCKACEDDVPFVKTGDPNKIYFAGIDTGKHLHVVIGHEEDRKPIVDYIDVLDSYDEVDKLFQNFNIGMLVCDNRPEPTPIFDLFKKHECVRGAEHNTGIVKPTSTHGKEEHTVGWNRFFSIERIYNYIIQKNMTFPANINSNFKGDFYKHLVSQMKVETYSENSQQKQVNYRPTNGKKMADHFLFGLIFMMAARDVYNELVGQNQPSGFILM